MNALISSTFSLAGKSILVSGASSGIGAHFAKVLAKAGCDNIVLAARRVNKLEELAHEIRTDSPNTHVATVPIDVNQLDSITNGVKEAEKSLKGGIGVLNVLINCSGIANPKLSVDTNEKDWDNVLDVNLKGNFFMATEFAKRLIEVKEAGSVINVASILSLRPGSRQANYCASKAAMLMFNKVHAIEWSRYSIRSNCICPGYFATEMNGDFFESDAGKKYLSKIPPKRLGKLSELNGPLLLLASDASSFMTGTEIVVDLGHTNAAL
jgi:NAD(P)-dependent dehydrogenase (short-subunit alcohol dehydrogenase family)